MQLKNYKQNNNQISIDSDVNVKWFNISCTYTTATESKIFIYFYQRLFRVKQKVNITKYQKKKVLGN